MGVPPASFSLLTGGPSSGPVSRDHQLSEGIFPEPNVTLTLSVGHSCFQEPHLLSLATLVPKRGKQMTYLLTGNQPCWTVWVADLHPSSVSPVPAGRFWWGRNRPSFRAVQAQLCYSGPSTCWVRGVEQLGSTSQRCPTGGTSSERANLGVVVLPVHAAGRQILAGQVVHVNKHSEPSRGSV